MQLKLVITLCIACLASGMLIGETLKKPGLSLEPKKENYKHSIGSSFFLFGNLAHGDSPYYFQLNYGYQLSRNGYLNIEALTWTYYEPLGTYGNSVQKYPGSIRAFGIGIGYQHFIWNNLYAAIQVTPFIQNFIGEDDRKIQNGFQLYMSFITGYRFEFFKKRFYIEPAIALKYWPVESNFPDAFDAVRQGTGRHIFEPSIYFGFRF